MLSNPNYDFSLSFDTSSSSNSSVMAPRGFFPSRPFSQPTIYPLLLTSQMPSQPIMMKSKFLF